MSEERSQESHGEAGDVDPRAIIAIVLHAVHGESARAPESSLARIVECLERLEGEVERRCGETGVECLQEILQRAPWLTSEVSRLTRHRDELKTSLQSFQRSARESDDLAALASRIGGAFERFADRFREYNEAEQELLDQAFPAPDWTNSE